MGLADLAKGLGIEGKPVFNIFWPGRNTGQIQSASNEKQAVRLACEHPSTGAINPETGKCNNPVAVNRVIGRDLADVIKGKWVRTRADGTRNTSSGDYKYRPQLGRLAKGRKF